MKRPDQTRIQELFNYDPETGHLFWKARDESQFASKPASVIWNLRFAGQRAGHDHPRGHVAVLVDGRVTAAHRIIWLYVHGEWPDQIDHINGTRRDNRLSNLRNVSNAENAMNRPLLRKNTSGVNGVTRIGSKWVARIRANKTHYNLGRFDTLQEATAARKDAEQRLGFHPNHGRERAA